MANFTALAAARRAMTPGNVREDGLAGPDAPAPHGLRVGPGACVRRQGRGPARHRHAAAAQDRDRRAVSDPHGRARRRRRGRSPGGIPSAIVVGNAGTVNTGRHRSARRARRVLRAREALVPRRRRVRRPRVDRSRTCGRCSRAWSAPTRSRPTRTSGCTCPTRPARRSCASPGGSRPRFRKFPEYLASDPESPFPGRPGSPSAASSSRAASRR